MGAEQFATNPADRNPLARDRARAVQWTVGKASDDPLQQGVRDRTSLGGSQYASSPAYDAWVRQQRQIEFYAAEQDKALAAQGYSPDTIATRRAQYLQYQGYGQGEPARQTSAQAIAGDLYSQEQLLAEQADAQADYGRRMGERVASDAYAMGDRQRAQAQGWSQRASGMYGLARTEQIPTVQYDPRSALSTAAWMGDTGRLYDRQYREGTDPTVARAQLQAGTDQAIRSQMGAGRGTPLGMYGAMGNVAQMGAQTAQQTAATRAQEQAALRGAIGQQQQMAGQVLRGVDAQRADVQRGNIDAQNAYRLSMYDRAMGAAQLGQGYYAGATGAYGDAINAYGIGAQYGGLANQTRGAANVYGSRGDTALADAAEWERQKAMAEASATTGGAAQAAGFSNQMAMYNAQRSAAQNAALITGAGQVISGAAQAASAQQAQQAQNKGKK